jgi:hypothetical protein
MDINRFFCVELRGATLPIPQGCAANSLQLEQNSVRIKCATEGGRQINYENILDLVIYL